MDSFEKLINIFESFPGIGPRQAKRFAYYLLGKDTYFLNDFSDLLKEIKKEMSRCPSCLRHFAKKGSQTLCNICSDVTREKKTLMLIAKDTDLDAIEKSGVYQGYYFVLGGLLSILEKEPEKKIRIGKLITKIETEVNTGLEEVILALSATSEGENTEEYLKENLKKFPIKISVLGRGISSGTEIEYIDRDTLKGALENKK